MPRPPAKTAHLSIRIPVSMDERIDRLADKFNNTRTRVGQVALLLGIIDIEQTFEQVENTPNDIQDEFRELLELGEVEAAVKLWNYRRAS